MKMLKRALYVTMVTPLVISAVAFGFLPERIPAHYGFDGLVTRYGSRLEIFIGPLLYIAFGLFMLAMARFAGKQEHAGNHNNERVVLIAGIVILIVFNVLNLSSLYTAYRQVDELYAESDLVRLMLALGGVSLVAIGAVMPKLNRNSLVGLRTKWSLSSDEAWRKSQRFGGICLGITGILLFFLNAFLFSGVFSIVLSVIMITVSILVSVIYTYWVAKD